MNMAPDQVMDMDEENRYILGESEKQEAAELGITVEALRARFKAEEQDDSWLTDANVF